jgi:hypothetical protein
MHEIVFQARVDGLRVVFSFKLGLVDPNQFLSPAGILAKTVVGDTVKPGGKFRLSSEAANVFVSAEEGLLGKIICQCQIASRELPQKTADRRLVIADQLSEGMMIIVDKNPGNEIDII